MKITPEDIVSFLKSTLQYGSVYEGLVTQRVILNATEEREINVLDEEIQAESDKQRSHLKLEKASDTLDWLNQQGLTSEDWEKSIQVRLKAEKLKLELFGQEIETFYYQNQLSFDSVRFYQIIVPYKTLGDELFYQIDEEEISFYEAAHLYDIDEERRHRCGYEGIVKRQQLPPALAASLFGGQEGVLNRPLQTDQGVHLLLAEKFIRAELNEVNRDLILNQLSQEWFQREVNHLKQNSNPIST